MREHCLTAWAALMAHAKRSGLGLLGQTAFETDFVGTLVLSYSVLVQAHSAQLPGTRSVLLAFCFSTENFCVYHIGCLLWRHDLLGYQLLL